MEITCASHPNLSRIDIERFFASLSGKIETEKIEAIAAAMAESIVGDRADYILKCSGVAPSRFSIKRQQFHGSSGLGGTD